MKQFKIFGFTLIELLVVISIITVLAGLTVSTVQYAQNKAARDKAKTEIAAMELAIESYKIDNGDYPRDDTVTDAQQMSATANPQVVFSKGATLSASSSMVLYKALSGDTDADRVMSTSEKSAGRIYLPFKPGMLYPKTSTNTVTALVDPFGNVYGYSTIGSGTANTSGTLGMNPTVDLWSTSDPKKTGTTGTTTWITNW